MEKENKCNCGRRKWLIPVIAVVAALAVALVLALTLGGGNKTALYWNVDRMEYTNQDREIDAYGNYRMRFAVDGQIRELSVKDKKLVSAIDSRNVMILELDKDGFVIGVTDPAVTPVARKLYIKHAEGNTVYANGSMALSGRDYTLELTDDTRIYDVMPGSPDLGMQLQPGELTMADALVAYTDESGKVSDVFVTARSGSANVYWRTVRMWSNGDKRTFRVPDSEGVYSIEFACNGKLETLKCRDLAIVNEIDKASDSEAAFCFFFDKEGYIIEVRDIRVGAHGVRLAAGYVVRSVDGDTFTAANVDNVMVNVTTQLPPECGVYDVSEAAIRDGRLGQAVEKLQLGDRIYLWADADGTPLTVYIQHRLVDAPAFRIYPACYYDSGTKQTARTPNAEGWYLIELIPAGGTGVEIYRTKDKSLVNFLDSQGTTKIVGLQLDGDVITQVYSSRSLYGGSVVNKGRVVDQVVGCMMNVRRSDGRGASIAMVMTPECKVYDISGLGPLGAETQLRTGDVVEAQSNMFGQIEAVYITRRR